MEPGKGNLEPDLLHLNLDMYNMLLVKLLALAYRLLTQLGQPNSLSYLDGIS